MTIDLLNLAQYKSKYFRVFFPIIIVERINKEQLVSYDTNPISTS